MTPKEKAKELFESMYDEGLSDRQAKQCSLIAVNEIFNVLPDIQHIWEYWEEVKQEINSM